MARKLSAWKTRLPASMDHAAKPRRPAQHLRSEPWIIAGIGKGHVAAKSQIDWDAWVGDYSLIRDAIEQTYPEMFGAFNVRMWEPGGFHRPLAARQRKWKTKTGKANFIAPKSFAGNIDTDAEYDDVFQLSTFRSQGQFNTTVYSDRDRFRGVYGTRMVLFMNRNDIDRLGIAEGDRVSLATDVAASKRWRPPPGRRPDRARLQHPGRMSRGLLS